MSVFMKSTFELQLGAFDRFEASMQRFVPALSAQGWRLIGAYRNTTGNVCVATHVWEVPDADSVSAAAMHAVTADPTLLDEVGKLAEVVRSETVETMAPLAYHPSGS